MTDRQSFTDISLWLVVFNDSFIYFVDTACCRQTIHRFPTLPLCEFRKKEFLHYADVREPDRFAFVLLGNKVDESGRVVSEEEALAWCKENGDMPYFETSAKDNINVEKAFATAAQVKSLI